MSATGPSVEPPMWPRSVRAVCRNGRWDRMRAPPLGSTKRVRMVEPHAGAAIGAFGGAPCEPRSV
eukprot:2637738-Pyramimonas_sp.AAC.1